MKKQEFLNELSRQLCHLSPVYIEKALDYHSGIIDGRMEGGMSEEDSVAAFGSVEKAALEFLRSRHSREKHRISVKIKSMPTVWRLILSTILVFICYILVIVAWAVVASVCFVAVCLGIGGIGGTLGGIVMCFTSTLPVGLCTTGIGMVIAAVAILLIGPVRALIKGACVFCSFINSKIRALLAKEALSV